MAHLSRILKRSYSKLTYLHVALTFLLALLYLKCQYTTAGSEGNSQRLSQDTPPPNKRQVKCYMFVLIMTSPKGKLKRQTIRETWLSQKIYNGKTVINRFIIGLEGLPNNIKKELTIEEKEHSDIIFLMDHRDSYYSLTLKLLKTFVWIFKHIEAEFVMKVDDDTFVQLGKLLPSLQQRQSVGRIYWGFFRGNANVKRRGPWEEQQWFLSNNYLPYALGGGYILSLDLVEYLSKNVNWLAIYNSEDVSLGVWLSSIQVNRIHDVRFDTEYKTKGCSNVHVVSHKQLPEDMYSKHNQLAHHNKMCREEKELILTYDYNWNVSSSQCCKRVSRNTLKEFQLQ